jgi:hypothetical protein
MTPKRLLLASIWVAVGCTVIFYASLAGAVLLNRVFETMRQPWLGTAISLFWGSAAIGSIMPLVIGLAAWRYFRAMPKNSN